jgi:hypothetical protein
MQCFGVVLTDPNVLSGMVIALSNGSFPLVPVISYDDDEISEPNAKQEM